MNPLTNVIWDEKYRPRKVEDCVLPKNIKAHFEDIVKKGVIPHLTLAGPAGTGKTTSAMALCDQCNYEWIVINGSNEGRQIDTLRTKVIGFASALSFDGKRKAVIFDEFDFSNAESVQPALRSIIQEFSINCTFIFTCNFKNKIMDALRSRAVVIDFTIPEDEKQQLMAAFAKRACEILAQENVQFDKKTVFHLVLRNAPDWRRTIGELQRYSRSGILSDEILKTHTDNITNLVKMMREKDYGGVRKWVFTQTSLDMAQLIKDLDDVIYKSNGASSPQALLTMADYMYKHAFAVDPQVNIIAMLVQLMVDIEWK